MKEQDILVIVMFIISEHGNSQVQEQEQLQQNYTKKVAGILNMT
jgi:hypothetical protein